MAFEKIPLPYAKDALEPHIGANTMEVHYEKHHQAYATNLNKAVEGTDLANKNILDILKNLNAVPENIRAAVRNNGGGLYNHDLFWVMMSPNGGGAPSGALGDAINSTFGSFDNFKT